MAGLLKRISKLFYNHAHQGKCEEPTMLFISHPLFMELKKEAYAYAIYPHESGKPQIEYMGMKVYTVDNDDKILEVK